MAFLPAAALLPCLHPSRTMNAIISLPLTHCIRLGFRMIVVIVVIVVIYWEASPSPWRSTLPGAVDSLGPLLESLPYN